MGDANKTKSQLISELETLRQRLVALEAKASAGVPEQFDRKGESELSQSNERLRHLILNLRIAQYRYVQAKDGQFYFSYFDTGYAETLEIESEKVLADPQVLFRMIHPDDRAAFDKSLAECASTLKPWRLDYRYRFPSGETRWVRGAAAPASQPNGDIYWDGLLLDITERKEAEEELRRSEQSLRTILETISHGIVEIDTEGTVTYSNPAHHKMLGFPDNQLIGTSVLDRLGSDAERETLRGFLASAAREQPAPMPYFAKSRTQNGDTIDLQVDWNYKRDEQGNITGFISILTDITESKRAEEKLRNSEEKFRNLIEASAQGVIIHTDKPLFANQAAANIFGYQSPDEILELDNIDLIFAPDERSVIAERRKARLGGEDVPNHYVARMIRKDRKRIWIDTFVRIVNWDGEDAIQCTYIDITERRRAEEELRASERLLRSVIDTLPYWITVKDVEGRYLVVNTPRAQAVGKTVEDLIGRTIEETWDGILGELREAPPREENTRVEAEAIESKSTAEMPEYKVTRADGQQGIRYMAKFPLFDEAGNVTGLVSWSEDITERKKAEEELRLSEERLRQATELAKLGHWIWDAVEDKCIYCSEEHARIHGVSVEEYIARSSALGGDFPFTHPEDREKYRDACRALRNGADFEMEYRVVTPAGETRHVRQIAKPVLDTSGSVIHEYGTIQDITELKKQEAQLRQSQKMEAIGTLAGGVAHDFNNLLQIIRGYTYIAQSKVDANGAIFTELNNVLQASDRAAGLTRQLLTFSRQQIHQPISLNINELIGNLVKMLDRVIGEDIELKVSPGRRLAPVCADPGMLEQVLLNLCINAKDAMPRGGQITIATQQFSIDAAFSNTHAWANPGEYAVILVSDTGIGMPPEVQEKIFEPFFTTKGPGHGTGLGLSIVYGIIRQHEGNILVYSEEDSGTTFRIYLPSVQVEPAYLKEADEEFVPGGSETILVAEDEKTVLELVTDLLESKGYTVLTAANGIEALEMLSKHSEAIDMVILDVVMPKLGGCAVFEKMAELNLSFPVIFSTGYADNAIDGKYLTDNKATLIQKPYAPTKLFQAVRDALNCA